MESPNCFIVVTLVTCSAVHKEMCWSDPKKAPAATGFMWGICGVSSMMRGLSPDSGEMDVVLISGAESVESVPGEVRVTGEL